MDFIEKIPNKTIILDIPPYMDETIMNRSEFLMYKDKFNDFYVGLHLLGWYKELNDLGIKWYWPYPITSFYELQQIIKLHPSYVFLGAPLTFDLRAVKKIVGPECKIRMIANNAIPQYLLTQEDDVGIYGSWVRPEDVEAYSEYIDCLEFEVDYGEYRKEEILLDTYKAGVWPGNLNLLLNNFNVDVDNRIIPEELITARMNCGMKCMRGGSCKMCINGIILADKVRNLHYELKKNNND